MKLSLFAQEIADALTDNGIGLRISGCGEPVLFSASGRSGYRAMFLVLDPTSENPEEAERLSVAIMSELNEIQTAEGIRPAIIVRDLWERQPQMMTERMLAHCGIFTSVFARNCEVRRIDRATANAFLDKTHSYGGALCRHCYGLYIRNGVSGQTAQGQDRIDILSSGILQRQEVDKGWQGNQVLRMDQICLPPRYEDNRGNGKAAETVHR